MIFSYRYIKKILHCKTLGISKGQVKYVITDSRYPAFTSDSLFVAIKGKRYDGHLFIEEMYQAGVKAFLVETLPENKHNDAIYFLVDSSLRSLQILATKHRSNFHYPVVGITGSYGKSIVKEWLFDLINHDFKIVRSPKSYNSQLGVPISVLQMSDNNNLALFEAGISMKGEMQKLEQIIKPTIGVFTNIGNAHQEGFANIEEKINEKLILFKDSDLIIYPSHYSLLDSLIKQRYGDKQLKSWGTNDTDFLKVSRSEVSGQKTNIEFSINGENYIVSLPFTNQAFIENALTSLLTSYCLGISMEKLIESLNVLSPIEMRLELVEAGNNCTLINDFYNSDLTSISVALEFLKQQNNHKHKGIVLSDIPHTGFLEEEIYTTVAKWIKDAGIDIFVGVGKEVLKYKNLFPHTSLYFETTEDLLENIYKLPFSDSTILLKGSRPFVFERISHKLQLQAHETILKIDLNALLQNYQLYKSLIPDGVKVMAMVKAFSYGSGLFEVAKLLQHYHVDYLAVAYADEGVELRQNGIHVPIMVMNPETYTFDNIIEYRLEPVIYNFKTLELFSKAVSRLGYSEYPFHLKIDTGMHRLGFTNKELGKLVERLQQLPWLKIKSVFSHLAAAEDSMEDKFTMMQILNLKDAVHQLQAISNDKILVHILNSAGIERFSEYSFDMVRLGIGLYGISNSGLLRDKLMPVFSLRTIVSQVKELDCGATVGYNRKAKFENGGKIAVIPIGYADGIDRKLGNGVLKVKIKGNRVPIIGTICMDMCMVDVTGLDINEGDEVVIFETIEDINHISKILGTIPYEIFTSISRRVKRIYYHD